MKFAKFRNFIPFVKIKLGESIYINYAKKNCGISNQVFEENTKGEKQYEFTHHVDEKYYEVKRVR